MKIQVIGSGSMWTKYNSACYLIDDKIMVDFPNGACKYLYRLNILKRMKFIKKNLQKTTF